MEEKEKIFPRAWRDQPIDRAGSHGHPSTPKSRPKRRVEPSGENKLPVTLNLQDYCSSSKQRSQWELSPRGLDKAESLIPRGKRAVNISLSKLFDLQGGIIHDLFQIKRYLLNQVDVKVKLYRATPAFCLCSAEASADYKVDTVDVCLLARKIRVNSAVVLNPSAFV